MRMIQILGTIAAILLAIILLCVLVIWMEKKFPGKEYDERQKQARGNAYRLSFWTGMVYYLAVIAVLIRQVDSEKTVEPYLLVIFGVFLQTIVLHTYSLLTHSALPLSEKPVAAILSFTFCGAIQLLYVFTIPNKWSLTFVGQDSSAWVQLLAGCCFLYLSLMHLISMLWKVRDDHE